LLGDKKGLEVENLINSRSGRIHLFPGIPDSATVGFKGLQARGGFEVTSECIKGRVTYLEIAARRSVVCQIMNPWKGYTIHVKEVSTGNTIEYNIDKSNGECIVFSVEKGKNY
jgi:hypothetical protein